MVVDGGVEAFIGECGVFDGVGAGGEAEDADFSGVDVQLFCFGTDEAHGALGILDGGDVAGVFVEGAAWDAVFEDDAGDAD